MESDDIVTKPSDPSFHQPFIYHSSILQSIYSFIHHLSTHPTSSHLSSTILQSIIHSSTIHPSLIYHSFTHQHHHHSSIHHQFNIHHPSTLHPSIHHPPIHHYSPIHHPSILHPSIIIHPSIIHSKTCGLKPRCPIKSGSAFWTSRGVFQNVFQMSDWCWSYFLSPHRCPLGLMSQQLQTRHTVVLLMYVQTSSHTLPLSRQLASPEDG